jgi:hypothetical protein
MMLFFAIPISVCKLVIDDSEKMIKHVHTMMNKHDLIDEVDLTILIIRKLLHSKFKKT